MNIVDTLVVIGTVSAVVFSWASLLLSWKERDRDEMLYDELEGRILELMGKFKHVSSVRLEMLDRKIEEIKKVMREANDVYSSLMVKLTDIAKLKEELPEVVENISENPERPEDSEREESVQLEEDGNLEKRIVNMYDEGFSDVEIARRLGIGVGEVRLIISLFGRE